MRLLVIYASRYGQTRKIAERFTAVARAAGIEVHLWEVTALPERAPLPRCDSIVVAGAVYFDRYSEDLRDFLRSHAAALKVTPTALISVANAAMSELGLPAAEEYVRKLEKQTGFRPQRVLHVAGGETYTRYGFFTRWLMRRIAKKYGRKVDVNVDYDHTNWEAVEAFTREFVPARERELVEA